MSSSQPSSSSSAGASSTSSNPTPRRGVKRPKNLVLNGDESSWEDKPLDLACPLCFETLNEAMITLCGHTFCNGCILQSIDNSPKCPKCGHAVHQDNLVPNFAMDELVRRHKTAKAIRTEICETSKSSDNNSASGVVQILSTNSYNDLNVSEIDTLMMVLKRKKEVLTVESQEHQRSLVLEFLSQLHKIKRSEKEQLDKQVNLIVKDISQVAAASNPHTLTQALESGGSQYSDMSPNSSGSEASGFNTQPLVQVALEQTSMAARRRRMYTHFDELTKIYMDTRNADLQYIRTNDATVPSDGPEFYDGGGLDDFASTLSHISRYHGLKPLATLSYSADLLSNSNIVSSIEFDKDNEFFAIAGVTRKIKLFEYATVIGSAVDIHCPTAELNCIAKISCVAWSNYYKNKLASSDYDGCVSLWDASAACKTRTLSEHEKRVWSVDWSNGDPRLLASGSDDSKVKLWSTNAERSVFTLEAKANVCCVKFCPKNSFVIAFGCADHCIHYYDFRNPRDPLGILVGHKKAVSYVKFASKDELVSASTDSHLKLWNLDETTMDCVRSFKGHNNEKNFVGLATDGNYIACGSENNSLYVYYKYLSQPLFSFKFDNHRAMLERPRNDESTEFVSAVAWKKGSPIVIAANSQGAIKVLELI